MIRMNCMILMIRMDCYPMQVRVGECGLMASPVCCSIPNENEWTATQMSFNGKSLIYQLLSLPDVSTG